MTLGAIITDGRHQLVRLPEECRFPEGVAAVRVRARGREIILSPAPPEIRSSPDAGPDWESFFLDGPEVSEDFMRERASQTQKERETL